MKKPGGTKDTIPRKSIRKPTNTSIFNAEMSSKTSSRESKPSWETAETPGVTIITPFTPEPSHVPTSEQTQIRSWISDKPLTSMLESKWLNTPLRKQSCSSSDTWSSTSRSDRIPVPCDDTFTVPLFGTSPMSTIKVPMTIQSSPMVVPCTTDRVMLKTPILSTLMTETKIPIIGISASVP